MENGHVIDLAVFDFDFAAPEAAQLSQDDWETLLRARLLPQAERIFDEFTRDGRLIQIDQLEVDLGDIDYQDFLGELPERFAQRLRTALENAVQRIQAVPHASPRERIAPRRLHRRERLQAYLESGLLPGPLPGSLDARPEQADQLLATTLAEDLAGFLDYLRHTPQRDMVVSRLARQFSGETLTRLLRALAKFTPAPPPAEQYETARVSRASAEQREALIHTLLTQPSVKPDQSSAAAAGQRERSRVRLEAAFARGSLGELEADWPRLLQEQPDLVRQVVQARLAEGDATRLATTLPPARLVELLRLFDAPSAAFVAALLEMVLAGWTAQLADDLPPQALNLLARDSAGMGDAIPAAHDPLAATDGLRSRHDPATYALDSTQESSARQGRPVDALVGAGSRPRSAAAVADMNPNPLPQLEPSARLQALGNALAQRLAAGGEVALLAAQVWAYALTRMARGLAPARDLPAFLDGLAAFLAEPEERRGAAGDFALAQPNAAQVEVVHEVGINEVANAVASALPSQLEAPAAVVGDETAAVRQHPTPQPGQDTTLEPAAPAAIARARLEAAFARGSLGELEADWPRLLQEQPELVRQVVQARLADGDATWLATTLPPARLVELLRLFDAPSAAFVAALLEMVLAWDSAGMGDAIPAAHDPLAATDGLRSRHDPATYALDSTQESSARQGRPVDALVGAGSRPRSAAAVADMNPNPQQDIGSTAAARLQALGDALTQRLAAGGEVALLAAQVWAYALTRMARGLAPARDLPAFLDGLATFLAEPEERRGAAGDFALAQPYAALAEGPHGEDENKDISEDISAAAHERRTAPRPEQEDDNDRITWDEVSEAAWRVRLQSALQRGALGELAADWSRLLQAWPEGARETVRLQFADDAVRRRVAAGFPEACLLDLVRLFDAKGAALVTALADWLRNGLPTQGLPTLISPQTGQPNAALPATSLRRIAAAQAGWPEPTPTAAGLTQLWTYTLGFLSNGFSISSDPADFLDSYAAWLSYAAAAASRRTVLARLAPAAGFAEEIEKWAARARDQGAYYRYILARLEAAQQIDLEAAIAAAPSQGDEAAPDARAASPNALQPRLEAALARGDLGEFAADWPNLLRDRPALLRSSLLTVLRDAAARQRLAHGLDDAHLFEVLRLFDPPGAVLVKTLLTRIRAGGAPGMAAHPGESAKATSPRVSEILRRRPQRESAQALWTYVLKRLAAGVSLSGDVSGFLAGLTTWLAGDETTHMHSQVPPTAAPWRARLDAALARGALDELASEWPQLLRDHADTLRSAVLAHLADHTHPEATQRLAQAICRMGADAGEHGPGRNRLWPDVPPYLPDRPDSESEAGAVATAPETPQPQAHSSFAEARLLELIGLIAPESVAPIAALGAWMRGEAGAAAGLPPTQLARVNAALPGVAPSAHLQALATYALGAIQALASDRPDGAPRAPFLAPSQVSGRTLAAEAGEKRPGVAGSPPEMQKSDKLPDQHDAHRAPAWNMRGLLDDFAAWLESRPPEPRASAKQSVMARVAANSDFAVAIARSAALARDETAYYRYILERLTANREIDLEAAISTEAAEAGEAPPSQAYAGAAVVAPPPNRPTDASRLEGATPPPAPSVASEKDGGRGNACAESDPTAHGRAPERETRITEAAEDVWLAHLDLALAQGAAGELGADWQGLMRAQPQWLRKTLQARLADGDLRRRVAGGFPETGLLDLARLFDPGLPTPLSTLLALLRGQIDAEAAQRPGLPAQSLHRLSVARALHLTTEETARAELWGSVLARLAAGGIQPADWSDLLDDLAGRLGGETAVMRLDAAAARVALFERVGTACVFAAEITKWTPRARDEGAYYRHILVNLVQGREIDLEAAVQALPPQSLPASRAEQGTPSVSRILGADSQNGLDRDPVLTLPPGNRRSHAQEMGEKWSGDGGLPPETPKSDRLPGEEIHIANAGLVLTAPYLPQLFARLHLTENGRFKDKGAAERAIHLAQFVVDGNNNAPEYLLVLNKILCGVPLAMPIKREIELTRQEKEMVEGMLQAIIQNWKIIGNTSVEGLRVSFLQRAGRLVKDEEHWQLKVEKKGIDVLLDQLPWGIGTVKYAWMPQPLFVEWIA